MNRHQRSGAMVVVVGAILLTSPGCGGGSGGGNDRSGGMIPSGPAVAATMLSIQNNIFTPKCALSGCHTGPNPQPMSGGLDLTYDPSNPVSTKLLNVQSTLDSRFLRVDPGNSSDSYLFMKVTGDPRIAIAVSGICSLTTGTACSTDAQCPAGETCETTGARMPRNAPPLSAEELTAIRNWIDGGGPTTPGY